MKTWAERLEEIEGDPDRKKKILSIGFIISTGALIFGLVLIVAVLAAVYL